MTYKNSMKILINNFQLVWKQLLYMALFSVIIFSIVSAISIPTISMLKNAGWFDSVRNLSEVLYTDIQSFPQAITNVAYNFASLIKNNFAGLWASYIGFGLVLVLGISVLNSIGLYAVSECANARMTSLSKKPYSLQVLCKLKKSIPFALFRVLISIPVVLISCVICYLYLKFIKTPLLIVLMLPVVVVVIIALVGLQKTCITCVAPVMINEDKKVFKSFKRNFVLIGPRFLRVYSNTLCIMFTAIFINLFWGCSHWEQVCF